MMKLIILDRDGVINMDSENYIKSPDEWLPIPGSLEAIAKLTEAAYTIAVATNQSGIARGYYDQVILEKIHQKMKKMTNEMGGIIDHIFFCPHGPNDNCLCRKPKPGLFFQIAEYYQISLKDIPAIGDSLRDIMAATEAGCKPYLVLTGNGELTKEKLPQFNSKQIFKTLAHAVDYLLAN
ncbi:MAG: D-glycero-beta-D-manno-heptose-1,7-bisphosphate 7-phosphatase [Legionellaceae bacterium]